jgi:carbon monoxide dehydrogenase subunit G
MLTIQSHSVTVPKEINEVFNFVFNLDNTSKLMPSQITNWVGNETEASYTLQGMTNLKMAINSHTKPDKIEIKSIGDKPFSFEIDYNLKSSGNGTEFNILFRGDVNLFMKAMVEKPLTNLFNFMAEQLPKQFA